MLWRFAASSLGLFVQHSLSQINIWKDPFSSVKDSFQAGQGLCERWCESCYTLTAQFWKRYSPHQWKGNHYVPENLNQFAKRLDEVVFLWSLSCLFSLSLCHVFNHSFNLAFYLTAISFWIFIQIVFIIRVHGKYISKLCCDF